MKLYNSLTRKKEEFVPLKEGRVGIYVCGPTVYDVPHIGHARSAYIFDCIRRYLTFKGYKVTFVRNVTDVDDKIIEKAKEGCRVKGVGCRVKGEGVSIAEEARKVAKRYLDEYHEDMKILGIGEPDEEPRATEYIQKMIKFISTLIKNGCAYEAAGDVYFDIKKAKDYGKLSNQNLEKMESGARVSPGDNKKDPLDFALWKSAKEDEPFWESPWGRGRPGWHIECSVMSTSILGGEFDIHGGGIDLIFPHHENEIAQSEGAGKKFARYWIHNGLLTIKGEKMAKSLGNFITIKDFVARHKDSDYLKLLFLSAHYRSPIDYTEERIEEARKEKERFGILLEKLERIAGCRVEGVGCRVKDEEVEKFRIKFEEAMDDDFNTPLALASLFDLVTYANKYIQRREKFTADEVRRAVCIRDTLLELASVLSVDLARSVSSQGIDKRHIVKMIDERNKARRSKDFKTADGIRKALSDMGVILEDTKDGTEWRIKV